MVKIHFPPDYPFKPPKVTGVQDATLSNCCCYVLLPLYCPYAQ